LPPRSLFCITVGMEITWPKLIAFAGASGILSALVNHAFTVFREWRSTGRYAAYLAIRIATTLETFAGDCMSVIGEFDTHRQSAGAAGSQTTRLPALADFPSDEDGWRALPTELTAKALAFPNHLKAGQERVSFSWSVAGEHAAWDDCQEECARLGLQAWLLARELRKRFSTPPFEPRYDLASALQREVADWNNRRS
jgi:hypothetical protein